VSVCVCVYGTARCCQEMFVHGRVQFVCVHRTRLAGPRARTKYQS